MKLAFRILCITFLLSSCGGEDEPPQDSPRASTLSVNQSITVSNTERDYHLYLPADAQSAPIVVLLHGNGGSSDQVIGLEGTKAPHKVWLDIAERENIVLLVPNGSLGPNDKRGWNDCRNDAPTNPASDDVEFLSELIDFVKGQYGSSEAKVFLAGTSNGGLMSMRLAEAIPERLSAIAVIVAEGVRYFVFKAVGKHVQF